MGWGGAILCPFIPLFAIERGIFFALLALTHLIIEHDTQVARAHIALIVEIAFLVQVFWRHTFIRQEADGIRAAKKMTLANCCKRLHASANWTVLNHMTLWYNLII